MGNEAMMKQDDIKIVLVAVVVCLAIAIYYGGQIINIRSSIGEINLSIEHNKHQLNQQQVKKQPQKAIYQIVYSNQEKRQIVKYLTTYYLLELMEQKDNYFKVSGNLYDVVALINKIYDIDQSARPDIDFKAIKINLEKAELLLSI